MDFHEMECADRAADSVVLSCPECDRTVIVGLRTPRLEVVKRGDESVRHLGGLGDTVMAVAADRG